MNKIEKILEQVLMKHHDDISKQDDDAIEEASTQLLALVMGCRPNKEKILVSMMNQIPQKYHNNPDLIKEFTDIIEDTLTSALQQWEQGLKGLFNEP